MAGRSLVVTIWSHGETADRADRAALLALALQRESHTLPVCIVTGRGLSASPRVGGALIDLGAAILRATPRGVVRLDEATAGALGPRFLVSRNAEGQLVLDGASEEAAVSARPTRFAGRERELAMLEGMVEGCASEPQAGAVLVLGTSGAGKSRLMDELRTRLGGASSPRDARTIFHLGRADVASSGVPYGVLADAIRRGAGLRRGEGVAARSAKLLDRMGNRVPPAVASKAAALLAELTGGPAPLAAGTPVIDPAAAVDATREAMETFLTAECALAPVLLALEDAQWADAASLTVLASVLRTLRDLPLVVVAVARPELLDRFPGLWCERDVQVIRLGPLSRRASEGIVKEALGARATDAVMEQVIERAGGNPFYLRELVRAFLEGRGDALPASVLDAVEARLSAEGSETRRMLRAASIFGRRFSRDGIAALTGVGAAQASACLERLEARELIAPASSPGRTGDLDYVFRHALVLEAAYATLTDDDRALGHQLALAWLGETQAAAPSSSCTPR
jgi:predicted ATPase